MKNIVQDAVVGNPQQYMQWAFTIEIYYYSPTTVKIDLSGNKYETD